MKHKFLLTALLAFSSMQTGYAGGENLSLLKNITFSGISVIGILLCFKNIRGSKKLHQEAYKYPVNSDDRNNLEKASSFLLSSAAICGSCVAYASIKLATNN